MLSWAFWPVHTQTTGPASAGGAGGAWSPSQVVPEVGEPARGHRWELASPLAALGWRKPGAQPGLSESWGRGGRRQGALAPGAD